MELDVVEVRRSPISPVTWANAEDNSVLSLNQLFGMGLDHRLQGGLAG